MSTRFTVGQSYKSADGLDTLELVFIGKDVLVWYAKPDIVVRTDLDGLHPTDFNKNMTLKKAKLSALIAWYASVTNGKRSLISLMGTQAEHDDLASSGVWKRVTPLEEIVRNVDFDGTF